MIVTSCTIVFPDSPPSLPFEAGRAAEAKGRRAKRQAFAPDEPSKEKTKELQHCLILPVLRGVY